ncbi:MAG: hypothetical protein J6Z12_04110 [Paludibacteraceae bacterium]|nr:hypothetical protein [Paludibacteraceae bacterium]
MANKISKIVFLVLVALTAVVIGLFYLGGDVDPTAEYVEPVYTGALVNLMFGFVALAALAVLVMVGVNFVLKLMADPKKALLSTLGFVGFLVFVGIIYAIAPGEQINILGIDEVPSHTMVKIVDAELYLMYIMTGAALLLMICGSFAKKLK